MTEQECREKLQEGFKAITPKVKEMTNIIMDAYEAGFNACWKLFTGKDFQNNNE